MKSTLGLLAAVVIAGATLAPVLWADCDSGDPVFLQRDRRELIVLRKVQKATKLPARKRKASNTVPTTRKESSKTHKKTTEKK